jgi:putative nucleotidyltransferase with HDIG domain
MHTPDREERVIKHAERLPRLSSSIHLILRELTSATPKVVELSRLVEQDVALATHVLQIGNSAMYGARGRITSVQHVIAMVGLARFRSTVTSLAVLKLYEKVKVPALLSLSDFNRHSLATAVAADLLAQHIACPFEGAFLAGLLHDIGVLACASAFPAEYEQVLELAASTGSPRHECERQVLGLDHAQVGFTLLRKWGLSPHICQAVREHHDTTDESSPVPGVVRLGTVIRAAESFARDTAGSWRHMEDARLDSIAYLAPAIPGTSYDAASFATTFLRELTALERDILGL